MLKKTLNAYDNCAIATQEVIEELIKLAKQLSEADKRGVDLGLNDDEVAFYEALAANNSALEVMGKDNLKVIATELVTQVRKSVTIDWILREGGPRQNSRHGETHSRKARLPTRSPRRCDQACLATGRTALRGVGRVECLVRLKRVALAFWTAVCHYSRDRPREMLHVSTGDAFPAERSQFELAREKR